MFYPLMLLETGKAPFSSSEYIFEPKFDGIRLQLSTENSPMLYTRNGNVINKQFPELLTACKDKFVLDGELIGISNDNKEDFEGIMQRFRIKKEDKIAQYINIIPVNYKVFDILHYNGKDLRQNPLIERKTILQNVIDDNSQIQKVNYLKEDGEDYFEQVKLKNLEGMVAKKINSPYVGKRSSYWLKIINWIDARAIIVGWRKKDNALLCTHENGTPLGLVLSGMSPYQKEAFFRVAKNIKTKDDSYFYYIEPIIKCKLKGRGFLSKGILRSPIFVDFIT